VVRAFSRRGSAFERIRNQPAADYSRALLDGLLGRAVTPFAPDPAVVLRDLRDPFDVEDLVYVYLQAMRDWLVLPVSRRAGTAAYEYELVHRDTQQLAIVQVKTGDQPVPIDQLARIVGETHVAFAYSTRGNYEGSATNVTRITDDELLDFAVNRPHQLPPRVREWFTRAARTPPTHP
jgi:hypothetical protein